MCLPCTCLKSSDELYLLGMEYWNRLPKEYEMSHEQVRRDANLAIKSIKLLIKAADQNHVNACIEVARKVFACQQSPWFSHGGCGSKSFRCLVNKSLGKKQTTLYKDRQDEVIHRYLSRAENLGSPGTAEMKRLLNDHEKRLEQVGEQIRESNALGERVRQQYIRDHAQEIMLQNSEDSLRYQKQQLSALEDIRRMI